MSGLVLAATVRQRWPSIGLLVTSGRVRPSTGELPDGAGFIAKPYKASELVTLLEAVFPRHDRDV